MEKAACPGGCERQGPAINGGMEESPVRFGSGWRGVGWLRSVRDGMFGCEPAYHEIGPLVLDRLAYGLFAIQIVAQDGGAESFEKGAVLLQPALGCGVFAILLFVAVLRDDEFRNP